MFLRRERRWPDTWGLIAIGVVLSVVSVIGLTGAFGEIDSAGKLDTIVLFGVPLGLFAIGAGVVNAVRGGRDQGGTDRGGTDADEDAADTDGGGPARG
ncbi:hypothetical protein CMsap09_13315 [Clavibacter michiganensis]|uniref:Uncharacterized protein n=1 Tax=Clavibacter michiganensis TaxID=28447 RepID=A0A251XWM8_9MICO|nr:hypothetical protein CMsap09_13315 [Clavibacter michiganensis]